MVNLVCEWGSVFILAAKGEQLVQLTEKDTQSKLHILFKKNHYQMAIEYFFFNFIKILKLTLQYISY